QGRETFALLFHEQDRPAGPEHEPVARATQEGPCAAVEQGNVERCSGTVEIGRIEAMNEKDRRCSGGGQLEILKHPGRVGQRELASGESLNEVASPDISR